MADTGTATIISLASMALAALIAACIVAPVARPSSTRMTVLFFRVGVGRPFL